MMKQKKTGNLLIEKKKALLKAMVAAIEELEESDFTDDFIALNEKAEQVAEIGRKAFTVRIGDKHYVDMPLVDKFNQMMMNHPTKYGIISVFVMHEDNESGTTENWQTIDVLMIEEELWETAYSIEDFHKVIPIANKSMTTEELFSETKASYITI